VKADKGNGAAKGFDLIIENLSFAAVSNVGTKFKLLVDRDVSDDEDIDNVEAKNFVREVEKPSKSEPSTAP